MREGKHYHGNIHYEDLIDQARKKRLRVTRDTEKRVKSLFADVSKELQDLFLKSKRGSLTERWALDYKKEIDAVLKEMRQQQYDITKQGMKKAANVGIFMQQSLFSSVNQKYSLDLGPRFSSMFSRIPESALNEILSGKIYTDGKGLSRRIWQNSKHFEKDIGYVIEQGILAKKSAIDLAKDLEKYINPGRATDYTWAKCYPNLVGKKCSYEAQRLARTSISHAYQLSTVRSCKGNPYVDGIQWQSAFAAGRSCDMCKNRDGQIFPAKDIPLDHPNGLCSMLPVVSKSMEQIGAELRDWVNGKPNQKVDKWLGQGEEQKNASPNNDDKIKLNTLRNHYPEKHVQQVQKILENATSAALAVWNKYEHLIDFDSLSSVNGFYSPRVGKISLYLDNELSNPQGAYGTTFHEIGHLFDHKAGNWISVRDIHYIKLLNEDYEDLITETKLFLTEQLGRKPKMEEVYGSISNGLRKMTDIESSGISDILSGLSKNKIHGNFGHGDSYWEIKYTVNKEAFAQMFQASIMQKDKLENMKIYFPKAYSEFEKMLEELVKNE